MPLRRRRGCGLPLRMSSARQRCVTQTSGGALTALYPSVDCLACGELEWAPTISSLLQLKAQMEAQLASLRDEFEAGKKACPNTAFAAQRRPDAPAPR